MPGNAPRGASRRDRETAFFLPTQQREDMLEVRRGTRRAAKRRRIQWSSPGGEEKQRRDTAAGLEATRAEVLMWQPVAREVEYRPQEKRRDSRPAHSAGGRTRGHMERDDHGRLPSRSSLPRSPRDVRVAELGSGCLVRGRRSAARLGLAEAKPRTDSP